MRATDCSGLNLCGGEQGVVESASLTTVEKGDDSAGCWLVLHAVS